MSNDNGNKSTSSKFGQTVSSSPKAMNGDIIKGLTTSGVAKPISPTGSNTSGNSGSNNSSNTGKKE